MTKILPEQVESNVFWLPDVCRWAELRSVSCRALKHHINLWDIDRLLVNSSELQETSAAAEVVCDRCRMDIWPAGGRATGAGRDQNMWTHSSCWTENRNTDYCQYNSFRRINKFGLHHRQYEAKTQNLITEPTVYTDDVLMSPHQHPTHPDNTRHNLSHLT